MKHLSALAKALRKLGYEEESSEIEELEKNEKEDNSYQKSLPSGSEVWQRAVNEFGLTRDPKLAGFVGPNGELLDFSGGSRDRVHDHREVERLVGEYGPFEWRTDAMNKFMNLTNAIRFAMYGDTLFIDTEGVLPTKIQVETLSKIFRRTRPEYFGGKSKSGGQVDIDMPRTFSQIYNALMDNEGV
jgi:hypothetical protein